eukprot:Filipodium_phascolosomae@DN2351_c0_g1_i2.p1
MSGADKKADTQRTDVTECFNFFDQDHDGKLQPNQVGIALRSLGQLWTEKELAALKAEFEGKLIGLEDFMKLMARKPIVPQPEQAAKLVNALRVKPTLIQFYHCKSRFLTEKIQGELEQKNCVTY